MICFLHKWPQLFEEKKVYIIPSPRYIFTKNEGKKNEERIYCYTDEEYENALPKYTKQKGYEVRFIKGLGSHTPAEYRDVLNSEDRYIAVDVDDAKCLETMFSPDAVEDRRKIMEI